MRILYIITGNDPVGGAMIHVTHLAQAIARQSGFTTRVLLGPDSAHAQELLSSYAVDFRVVPDLVRSIRPLRDIAAVAALRREIRDFAPDLVSTHSSKAGIAGRLAARLERVRVIFTAHGWAFTDGVSPGARAVYRTIEKFFQRFADRIICVSNFDRKIALQAGFRPERLVTVHNGVPSEVVEPPADEPARIAFQAARARLVDEPGVVNVAMVARLSGQKDHKLLFRAAAAFEKMHVYLIGNGDLEGDLRNLARELGIERRVHFLGYSRYIAWLLRQMDMFCLVSNYEGFPRTTIEAMAQGLPVIVSDVGGATEAFEEGVSGFAVGRGNLEKLVEVLGVLVSDGERRRSMGAAARERYRKLFTLDALVKNTLEVYQ